MDYLEMEQALNERLTGMKGHSLVNQCQGLSVASGLPEDKVVQLYQFCSDIYWDKIFQDNDYSFKTDEYWIDLILINWKLNKIND